MVKRLYLEVVLNEFYAYYGEEIEKNQLFKASLEHPHLSVGRHLYLVLQTGVVKLAYGENQYILQTGIGCVEALFPSQILHLARLPRLVEQKHRAVEQLEQFAGLIDQRLSQTTVTGLRILAKRLEYIYLEVESVESIQDYTNYFWHGTFIDSETSLTNDSDAS